MADEITQEDQSLLQKEILILKMIEQEAGQRVTPQELSRRSPLGMRETQAIVSFLLRREFITESKEKTTFLQITKKGIDVLS